MHPMICTVRAMSSTKMHRDFYRGEGSGGHSTDSAEDQGKIATFSRGRGRGMGILHNNDYAKFARKTLIHMDLGRETSVFHGYAQDQSTIFVP